MPDTDPRLPEGWTTTRVTIEERVAYDVIVSHPKGARDVEIAASAMAEYIASDDRGKDFSNEVLEEEVRIDAEEVYPDDGEAFSDALPDWHYHRPEIAAYAEPESEAA